MSQNKYWPGILTAVMLLIFMGVALYLRIALPYDKVFSGDWVKFTGTDTYFYMRLVDNIVHNFPRVIEFDPYLLFPHGAVLINPPFFHFLLSAIIFMAGLGPPSAELIDKIGIFFPPVLAALCVISVYFIGKALVNRWAGIIAAGLIAISPGEILGRSILGFTDQHIAEILISTTAALFIILALKSIQTNGTEEGSASSLNLYTLCKPIIYSLLGGIFLGLYAITWYGALLFILLVFLFFIVQFILNHLRKESGVRLCLVNSIIFAAASIIFVPVAGNALVLVPLLIAFFIPLVLCAVSILFNRWNLKPWFYPASIVIVGALALGIFYLVSPALFKTLFSSLSIFSWHIGTTIQEMQPIFLPSNKFSVMAVWLNFSTGFIFLLLGLVILIYRSAKENNAAVTFIIVWSLVILLATLAMRRFAYYLAVNVAVICGYMGWIIIQWFARHSRTQKSIKQPAKKDRKHKRQGQAILEEKTSRASPAMLAVAAVFVFLLLFLPNISPAVGTAASVPFAPSNAWCETLTWLRENTPDPFDNPDYYYQYYVKPSAGKPYQYPASAYSITAWWDYGYWITRIGHRIPVSNPGTNHNGEAYYFMAGDSARGSEFLDRLKSRYVIVDFDIATVYKKFYALAGLSGGKLENYADIYYTEKDGKLQPVIYYYPEYYQTMVIRLYNFDGQQAPAQQSAVITYAARKFEDGKPYKLVTSSQPFTDYEGALGYINSQKSPQQYSIVSSNPFVSCIPLQALDNYRLVYSSDSTINTEEAGRIPLIKVFEYSK